MLTSPNLTVKVLATTSPSFGEMIYALAPGEDLEKCSPAKAVYHDIATAIKSKKNVLFAVISETSIVKTPVYLNYMFFSESSFEEDAKKYGEKWPWNDFYPQQLVVVLILKLNFSG
jgi:hypothetical protein